MIIQGSRYGKARLVRVTLADGRFQWAVLNERTAVGQKVVYRFRTAIAGERFDTLAAQEYGDPSLWWVLARANPQVFYPEEIPPGSVLRIPGVESIR